MRQKWVNDNELRAEAYLGLGSNVGDRASCLVNGLNALHRHQAIEIVRVASLYETEAHTLTGDEDAPPFYNTVVAIRTHLNPPALLDVILGIETDQGRTRNAGVRWQPRTIDVDIVTYDNVRLTSERLTLPHARLAERRFVLVPLAEIAPDLMLPAPHSRTARDLLARTVDDSTVRRIGRFVRRRGEYAVTMFE